MMDLMFSWADLHEVPVQLFLQLVQVSLNSSKNLWDINHFPQFYTVCQRAERAVCRIIPVTKTLNTTDPGIDTWGTPLVTGL